MKRITEKAFGLGAKVQQCAQEKSSSISNYLILEDKEMGHIKQVQHRSIFPYRTVSLLSPLGKGKQNPHLA